MRCGMRMQFADIVLHPWGSEIKQNLMKIVIRNPKSTIHNPQSTIQNLTIQNLQSTILGPGAGWPKAIGYRLQN